jgi:hypothetical protein
VSELYPTAAESLAALQALLNDIKGNKDKYHETEFTDILTRLAHRIDELENQVRDAGIKT